MSTLAPPLLMEEIEPEIENLITEDDTPVDNIPSAKLQRSNIAPLYDSDYLPRPFLADCNIGIFTTPYKPPIVPDMFISLGVQVAKDWWAKKHRSYFIWEFGKPPDVVVEIVSNKIGGETSSKLTDYAELGVKYYVIYDPQLLLLQQKLVVYELYAGQYQPRTDWRLPNVGLTLTLWDGVFEDTSGQWLRWCDMFGTLLLNGAEQAQQARIYGKEQYLRAEEAEDIAIQAKTEAEQAKASLEQERKRVALLTARLRELGIDPALLA